MTYVTIAAAARLANPDRTSVFDDGASATAGAIVGAVAGPDPTGWYDRTGSAVSTWSNGAVASVVIGESLSVLAPHLGQKFAASISALPHAVQNILDTL